MKIIIVTLVFLCAPFQALLSTKDANPSAYSLDELIQKLPVIRNEGIHNSKTDRIDYLPTVVEMMDRLSTRVQLTDIQWQRALLSTEALRFRYEWPTTQPVAFSLRVPAWLGAASIRMRLMGANTTTGTAGDGSVISCTTTAGSNTKREAYQEIGRCDVGIHHLEFKVQIEKSESAWWEAPQIHISPGVLWEGMIGLDVKVVQTIDEAVPAVSDKSLEAAVRKSIGVAFSDKPVGREAVLVVDPDLVAFPILRSTALSLKIEVMQGPMVLETVSIGVPSDDTAAVWGSKKKGESKYMAFKGASTIPGELEGNISDRQSWHLRVSGTSEDVLKDWSATQRYAGQFDLPLHDAIQWEKERVGGKGRSLLIISRCSR